MELLFFITALAILWRSYAKEYLKGLCISVAIMVFMSHYLVIQSPGSLPNITIHRFILGIMLVFWLKNSSISKPLGNVPCLGIIMAWLFSTTLSLFVTVDFVFSLKIFLSLTIEGFLFFYIVSSSLRNKNEGIRLLKYAASAMVLVALVAIVERQFGLNPVDLFVPHYERLEKYDRDVLSTYPHRILFGAAMGMALPLYFAFIELQKRKKWLPALAVILVLLAGYYSFSRGPWLGMGLALFLLTLFAPLHIKRFLVFALVCVALAIPFNPGVRQTIKDKVTDTLDTDSFKGETYQYRWELWRIAFREVVKSPKRFLFGYGPGSGEILIFETELSYSGDVRDVWSWDNHYACQLLETGFTGLALLVLLHLWILKRLMAIRSRLDQRDAFVVLCVIVSVLVYYFTHTNVKIFAPQLNFLFWSLFAVGSAFDKSSAGPTFTGQV